MKERSAALDYIKGLSILSVICAHCNSVTGSASDFANVSSLILQNLGTFGVICFMVISGILYRVPQGNVGKFFGKKLKTIVIPWIISASLVWLYVYLRKPPLTLENWARFVIGDGSYLYYLTMLMLFYAVFTFLPFMRTKAALLVCQIITAISCLWFYQIGNLSPYLNPLNWIGFFALGMMMASRKEESVHRGGDIYSDNVRVMGALCGIADHTGVAQGWWFLFRQLKCAGQLGRRCRTGFPGCMFVPL